ncbi:MAG TPA: prepilin-type N-terminal cleavage/methylation domain-containing protein [Candidatus Acidoferrum sp.]|nr:prepilin-type N-terminal cleavage/methylation domain-containing protein [Candidatus Acidoferrum sp.]
MSGDRHNKLCRAARRHRVQRVARRGNAGYTLVELLIGAFLFLVILTAIYAVFESNRRTFAAGERKVEVQQSARVALEALQTDLRLAGYGYPTDPTLPNPVLLKITGATATSISFWADLNNKSTTLSADVAAGVTALPVASASGVAAGEILWLINGGQFESSTVQSVAGNTITVTAAISAAYPQATVVGRPRAISYSWDAGTKTLSKDDGEGGAAQPVVTGIQAFTFQYFDTSDTAITAGLAGRLKDIRRIRISMTVESSAAGSTQTFDITSDARPRNLL